MKARSLSPARSPALPGGGEKDAGGQRYVLSLFISGMTPRSTAAVTNIKRICETKLQGRYELEIVDIYQQPALAKANQIIAVPTLIKRSPFPMRRLIGDMSNEARVLAGLEIE